MMMKATSHSGSARCRRRRPDADEGEHGQPDHRDGGTDHSTAADSLPRDEEPEGHREDHQGDEQRLDDRQPTAVEAAP
jgi:hypothetical protein